VIEAAQETADHGDAGTADSGEEGSGLRDADDSEIWEYAKANGYAIVSKDSDFQQRSLLRGAPPKFIWLRVGNCTVKRTENLLRTYSAAIHTFDLDESKSHLMLP